MSQWPFEQFLTRLRGYLPHQILYFIDYWRGYPKFGGRSLTCSICRYSFKELLPYGVPPRKNARCPVCLSLERHRLYYLFLRRETPLFRQKLKMLHVAPEKCFSTIFSSKKNITYTSIDLLKRGTLTQWDLTALPVADGSFDVLLCIHVLEHIPDDRKAMRECFRVLKKGGWALFDVPIRWHEATREDPLVTDPRERERLFGRYDHVRYYGKDFPDRLREAGFSVTVMHSSKLFSEKDRLKYSILTQNFFYCIKG